MPMNDTQRLAVLALTPIQAFMAWNHLHKRHRQFPSPPSVNFEMVTSPEVAEVILPTSEDFLLMVEKLRLDHATVVLPLCRVSHTEATAALETLIGHPLTRLAARGKARAPTDPRIRLGMMTKEGTPRTPKERAASGASTDTRTITFVAENPKKPGSASHLRFVLYVVGDKVMDAIAKGVTSGDIKWDTERGFIKLGA